MIEVDRDNLHMDKARGSESQPHKNAGRTSIMESRHHVCRSQEVAVPINEEGVSVENVMVAMRARILVELINDWTNSCGEILFFRGIRNRRQRTSAIRLLRVLLANCGNRSGEHQPHEGDSEHQEPTHRVSQARRPFYADRSASLAYRSRNSGQ